uniref:Uncharacterized protein n=1 Tax=Phenylobacterium glaciei TaxID=2803784 RepID=A0A974S8I1_9CAUL|nr:hypothetical protein JKL49_08415 [Phenylobacterium glaciei]
MAYVGDGDSMAVGQGNQNWVEVRVADFHAPDLRAPGGAQAKAALERITAVSAPSAMRNTSAMTGWWPGVGSEGDRWRT